MAGQGTSAAQQVLDAALAKLTQTHGGERQALSGYTHDILGYLKGTPKAIGSDYQGAINQQNGFANQYAAQQRQANPNAQIQHDLRAINAPPEQIAQLAAQNQKAYGGSAANLYALGGAIPNSAFAADKAGALAFARSLPAIEGLRGQQLITQLLANQGKESTALAGQKADLLYKEQANRDSLAARTSYGPGSTKAPTTRSFKDGTTRQYNPTRGGWDVVARAEAGAKANGGYTASQRISFQRNAGKIAAAAFNGKPATQTDENGNLVHGTSHLTYQEAMSQGLAQGIPLTVMQKALNQYWHRPGFAAPWETAGSGEGRPKKNYQQRHPRKRKAR